MPTRRNPKEKKHDLWVRNINHETATEEELLEHYVHIVLTGILELEVKKEGPKAAWAQRIIARMENEHREKFRDLYL